MELQLANNISNSLILLFMSLYKDFEVFFSSVRFLLHFSTKWSVHRLFFNQNPCKSQTFEGEETRISGEEMNVVVNRLGIMGELEDISEQDLVSLFEEQEPSLEEIKECFKVFDVNNDGLIDGSDLYRVVCSLGLKERYELEDCKKMIQNRCNFDDDDNGGEIDFQVFVKFMDKCLCSGS